MAWVYRPSKLILLVFVLQLLQNIGHCRRLRKDRKLLNGDGRLNGDGKSNVQVLQTEVSIEGYDLLGSISFLGSAVKKINNELKKWDGGTEIGLWHTGVVVFDREWSFGYTDKGTGIFAVAPRQCSRHSWSFTHSLGSKNITEADVERILAEMRPNWHGTTYDLLRRNCGHFTCEFLTKLELTCPAWVTKLAGVGAKLQDDGVILAMQRAFELASQSLKDKFGDPKVMLALAGNDPGRVEHPQKAVEDKLGKPSELMPSHNGTLGK